MFNTSVRALIEKDINSSKLINIFFDFLKNSQKWPENLKMIQLFVISKVYATKGCKDRD